MKKPEKSNKSEGEKIVSVAFWFIPLSLSLIVGLFTLDFGFVLDDRNAILSNPVVTGDLSIDEAFRRDFVGTPLSKPDRVLVWRPILPIIWKFIWQLGNGTPKLFRFFTIFLHSITTALVLIVGKKLLKNETILFMSGILFAVHPIHSEVLGSLVSQADILSTILGLITIWLIVTPGASFKSILLIVILGIACLVKETAVVFGAIVVLVALVHRNRYLKGQIVLILPSLLIIVAIIYFQVTIERGGSNPINNLVYGATGFERTLHGLYIVGRSISMCFLPLKLSPTHDYAAIDLSLNTLLPFAFLAILFLIICCAFFFRTLETRNVTWMIGIVLLTGPPIIQSSLIVCVNTELAERLLYPSSIVSCTIISVFIFHVLKLPSFRWIVLTLVTTVFLFQSWHIERKWQSNFTLFEYAVKAEFLSWRAHNNFAICLANKKQPKEALWHFMVAAYILSNRPRPVDPSPIKKLNDLPIDKRLIEGPSFFSPDDPLQFIEFFYEHLIFLFKFPGAIEILAPYYAKRYKIE
jgi:hypothetical protein